MVYKIYCDGNIIHNPQALIDTLVLKDVTLDMEDNTAGTLTFTILPTHQFYGAISYFASRISVYQENVLIWKGRPNSVKPNEDLSITYTCEGMLAFFNDVLKPKVITNALSDQSVIAMLEDIVDEYNERNIDENDGLDTILLGTITDYDGSLANSYLPIDEEYPLRSCFEALSHLISNYDLHAHITFDNDEQAYLNITAEFDPNIAPVITAKYGTNVISYDIKYDYDNLATVLYPEARSDQGTTTISTVNNGVGYLINQSAVDQYGWIEHTYIHDGNLTPAALKAIAQEYLDNILSIIFSFEATILYDAPASIYDPVLVNMAPIIPNPFLGRIYALNLDISNPANTQYKLTDSTVIGLTDYFKRGD
jgi:hypothetical protein